MQHKQTRHVYVYVTVTRQCPTAIQKDTGQEPVIGIHPANLSRLHRGSTTQESGLGGKRITFRLGSGTALQGHRGPLAIGQAAAQASPPSLPPFLSQPRSSHRMHHKVNNSHGENKENAAPRVSPLRHSGLPLMALSPCFH
ncbi:hypothetical protein E2C01_065701 [Portunus trituberculatus]|uniref:Uncharacterized protein n=1 Tax=Portunus trituberculatus TaxID=210409 RepID=A0A5B7HMT1_PORTR|nr:hypothetical protein [Portunus trituberculatus]